ncbi:unnamed protein product, partial [Discosporangium mesarthrocarpum]
MPPELDLLARLQVAQSVEGRTDERATIKRERKTRNGRQGDISFGIPFLVSGELFVRSTPELFRPPTAVNSLPSQHDCYGKISEVQHPSTGMLADSSEDFQQLILGHEGSEGRVTGKEARIVSSAWREQRAMRLQRIDNLRASKRRAVAAAKIRLGAVKDAVDGFRRGHEACARKLDTQLCKLVLRYAAAAEDELATVASRNRVENLIYHQEVERLRLTGRLSSYAAAVEQHTRGMVVLKRLQPSHPQHMRCRRAAMENVKAGFFLPGSPYDGVRVLEVYKIENRFLLERFQKAAKAAGPCKVKGLFCYVPDDSLEHLILHGVDSRATAEYSGLAGSTPQPTRDNIASAASGTVPCSRESGSLGGGRREKDTINATSNNGGNVDDEEDADDVDGAWFGLTRWVTGGARFTEALTRSSAPLPFPRAFSRHSTLEEERAFANGLLAQGDDGRRG